MLQIFIISGYFGIIFFLLKCFLPKKGLRLGAALATIGLNDISKEGQRLIGEIQRCLLRISSFGAEGFVIETVYKEYSEIAKDLIFEHSKLGGSIREYLEFLLDRVEEDIGFEKEQFSSRSNCLIQAIFIMVVIGVFYFYATGVLGQKKDWFTIGILALFQMTTLSILLFALRWFTEMKLFPYSQTLLFITRLHYYLGLGFSPQEVLKRCHFEEFLKMKTTDKNLISLNSEIKAQIEDWSKFGGDLKQSLNSMLKTLSLLRKTALQNYQRITTVAQFLTLTLVAIPSFFFVIFQFVRHVWS
ncbi:MAG: hypothetical protein ACPGJV_03960 [Bacteriovoracaceae bacterium]